MSRSLSLVMDAADVVEHGELRASKSELESNEEKEMSKIIIFVLFSGRIKGYKLYM